MHGYRENADGTVVSEEKEVGADRAAVPHDQGADSGRG